MAKLALGLASIFTKIFFPFSQKQDSAWDSYRKARMEVSEVDEPIDGAKSFSYPNDRFTRLIR